MKQAIYPNRTQISLSPELKALIEARIALSQESFSEYLRKAAIIRMILEDVEKNELALIAKTIIGSIPKNKSGWKDIKDISKWQREERVNEDKHRS
ncbi:hypothetical protein A3D00_02930 [Candidatus Woesebacteria bacterium RIFCSPHIGHO2_02_FULL_38_9]|uniref:Ribbon-helix-helix protein CopG domain-containing protein n=1 Tax=Candidatus Woesebacteria bacterium RIFCSPHIGHO2_01_FULL_39_28 TaxID=1802496 RepID=A0A1F7YFQ6_9BACT|nr:MAG: hypothetical protein A2627_03885 [Candidatus Woesebacteria bacterium RIFCSPHIGHO2_01_FULL_39_28]OGM35337.1 MAG: hypothetical protein A3D00_02930 [Candidatus Woesebacteria bacterium RIFCSPHIGHO2_02_FULL_38_9]OGM57233.1 MAG: hypothetical protein A3A50_00445 [Candidatus Woesebacteria bacterium RIFCSPLOWO2_01_FULL_38_20]